MKPQNDPLLQRLQAVFQDVFDDSQLVVKPTTGHADVSDWDSVAQVKLVLAIEDAFGIQFTTEEVSGFEAVADFLQALNGRGIGG